MKLIRSELVLNLMNSVTVPDMATFSTISCHRIEASAPSSLPKRSFSAKLLGL